MKNNKLLLKYYIYLQFGGKKKWTTFSHNGVLFPPIYKPHNIPVMYEGKDIILAPDAEEYATLYAKYIDTDYIKSNVFNKNFWKDWKKILGKDHSIKSLIGCDFTQIYNYILKIKEEKKQLSKEEKIKLKEEKDKQHNRYKYAIVDGKQQKVGNFRVEPPGIFIGRGCHPKLGSIKKRIYPEDITLNLDNDAVIPELPKELSTHKWGSVIHDKHSVWVASWKDTISGKTKYVWLSAHSDFKSESDIKKFNLARKLKKRIGKIRDQNDKNLQSSEILNRQIATALYLIDKLAIRVGNEKGKGEADTVGVVSLRFEHITLSNDQNRLTLNFLGKDSIKYVKTIIVPDLIYKNMKEFLKNKHKGDQLFDIINSNDINKYLQTFMKDLTAKVYRTFNASNLFQKELNKASKIFIDGIKITDVEKEQILKNGFVRANIKVALLCNHQKKVAKSFNSQIDKINEMIKKERKRLIKVKKRKTSKQKIEQVGKIKKRIRKLKVKKNLKIELKSVSLETSKANYIDPRITIAYIKKHKLDINNFLNKEMQEKFKWAINVDDNFKF